MILRLYDFSMGFIHYFYGKEEHSLWVFFGGGKYFHPVFSYASGPPNKDL